LTKVDIWLLLDGAEDSTYISEVQKSTAWSTERCCYDPVSSGSPLYGIAKEISTHLTGYARVIYFNEDMGIYKFQEGHFTQGY